MEKEIHEECEEAGVKAWQIIVAAAMLAAGIAAKDAVEAACGGRWALLGWHLAAFALVGWNVVRQAMDEACHGDVFSEYTLMSVAAIGAFAIGEYPEAVAVMLLYQIGEALQDRAVDRARDNIRSLMAFRPDKARLVEAEGGFRMVAPEAVAVGSEIEVRPGERVPLDGTLLSAGMAFDTSALTGESAPRPVSQGGEVLAGMIAAGSAATVRVSRPAGQSAVARILAMVEDATERKARTELFVRRFARVYTPVVIALAVLVATVPWLWSLADAGFAYHFSEWFQRALMFLVISCPCALVISVPLGYFAGIGSASRQGILFKGGNSIDAAAEVDAVAFDKTGTLTTGEFEADRVEGLDDADLAAVAAIEGTSSHPIARAVAELAAKRGCKTVEMPAATDIAGYGLSAGGWLVGTVRLLEKNGVEVPGHVKGVAETIVAVAKDGRYKGCIMLSDKLKDDARQAVEALPMHVEILSGDRQAIVDQVARRTGAAEGHGDLLPQDKVERIQSLKGQGRKVAFVGDGINDAPVIAISDVGVAMGALGADMAVETADIVIQDDSPSKVALAIAISRRTKAIVKQNIAFSIAIKVFIMALGAAGLANLWMAVFADSGVALLAVANSMRAFAGPKNLKARR